MVNHCIGWDSTGLVECRLTVTGSNGTLTVTTTLPELAGNNHKIVIHADAVTCVLLAYLMTENQVFMGVLNRV